jgi:hypothetical protein
MADVWYPNSALGWSRMDPSSGPGIPIRVKSVSLLEHQRTPQSTFETALRPRWYSRTTLQNNLVHSSNTTGHFVFKNIFDFICAHINTCIKSCSHEVAKHKSGVICQFHQTVPPLATTLMKMVTQSVRMGNAHAGPLRDTL